MAIEIQAILNPGEEDELIIEEPIGVDSVEISLQRDDKLHGMRFEASTSALEFYGKAALYLQDYKKKWGVKAKVILEILTSCEDSYDFDTLLKGRLNFGRFKDSCGNSCKVLLPWEEDSCALVFNSRYEQKVDLDRLIAFDNITPLQSYAGLGFSMSLPAQKLQVATIGDVGAGAETEYLEIPVAGGIMVRPTYISRDESLIQSQLQPSNDFGDFSVPDQNYTGTAISPFLLVDDNPNCFDGVYSVDIRLKGTLQINTPESGEPIIKTEAIIFEVDDPTLSIGSDLSPFTSPHYREIASQALPAGVHDLTTTFDLSFTDPALTLTQGRGLYAVVRFISLLTVSESNQTGIAPVDISVHWDPETHVSVVTTKNCPPSDTDAYLVHETLSRVTEAVTNNCMRVKSSYYGRTDSEPFAFPSDGCGGLRMLTSGLKIRQAEEDNFFASPKDLIEGLHAIDNIGMGIEPDPDIPNKYLLRIEDLEFFYRDVEILRLDSIPLLNGEVQENLHYAKVESGYTKWEVQKVKSLGEFNSTREHRTSIDTLKNTLDIKSNLVAGGFAIETTRQESFVTTGGADTTYDNETFIITLVRGGYAYGELSVEQGGILNPQNIFSPETVYNWRIRPTANLMRWFRSIAAGYPNISGTDNKLFFNSGTGNIVAEGEQESQFCKPEQSTTIERQDISAGQIQIEATPLWKNENVSFEYPLSLNDYNKIKENPYGFISYQCGNGDWEAGWIKELKYRPLKGNATFILRKKWPTL